MAIPLKDSLLVPFASNFSDRINTSPASFGLVIGQATALADLVGPYVDAVTALNLARADGTRSESLTTTRDTTKAALLSYARELYSFVQANTNVTDANKVLLGVHIRDTTPTPVPAPTVPPAMELVSVFARTVKVNIYDPTSSSHRSKVSGAVGAYVYTFTGEDYPTDPSLWQFQGSATKGNFDIVFPDTVANGAQVWICAAWVNRRGETGPVNSPIAAIVQGGLTMAA